MENIQVNITPFLGRSIEESFGIFSSSLQHFSSGDKVQAQEQAHNQLTNSIEAACERMYYSLSFEPSKIKRAAGYRAMMEREDIPMSLRRKYLDAYVNENKND